MTRTIGYVVQQAGFTWTRSNLYYPSAKLKKVKRWFGLLGSRYEPTMELVGQVGAKTDPHDSNCWTIHKDTEKIFYMYDEPLAQRLEEAFKSCGFEKYAIILHSRPQYG